MNRNFKMGSSSVFRGVLPLTSQLFSESVNLLQKLIKTPSYSGQEADAADLIYDYLSGYDIKMKRKGNNIWCYNKFFNASQPTVLLNSHIDTVKPNEGYTNDPFFPEITGGRLFGLGSNDAGGCLVSIIAAFLHFYAIEGLGFNLCLAVTAEEENSGKNGIKSILPHLGKLELAIVGEPTLLQMAIAEKGNLVLDCVSTGHPGHAAREEGDNAIYRCMKDLAWFRSYQFPQQLKGLSPVKMTVTTIKAGLQHNIIPGRCEFTVDIRNDNTYTPEYILKTIKEHISARFTVRAGAMGASSISLSHPIVKTGMALGCKTYSSPTTSDQAWLKIPSVKIGPGDSARSHAPDEYIFLEEIRNGIDLYIKLLNTLPLTLINNPKNVKNETKYLNN